jgi:dimethylargininase
LSRYFTDILEIREPGTLEAGDVMMVGSHFYIGLSSRTNEQGAEQLITHLKDHQMSGSMIAMNDMLHLKTGLGYLENNNLVACGEFLAETAFQGFNLLPVDPDETQAANCIWVNGTVLIPAHCPATQSLIEQAGYPVKALEISEFQKLDGGLSCLSLRF